MPLTNKVAKILLDTPQPGSSRIGGNIPAILDSVNNDLSRYYFYATIKNPLNGMQYLTILTPKDHDFMTDHAIYPDCSVEVVMHAESEESQNTSHQNKAINKSTISELIESHAKDFEFITVRATPSLIQDEEFYFKKLTEDGYEFFLQIDENYYPENLLNGSYAFNYGCLYIYKHKTSGKIIAGFWQYS
jgi:hypothetical protein